MGFALLAVYMFVFLVRPHEWGEIDRGIPIIQYLLLGCLAFFVFQRDKNLKAPELLLMGAFLGVIAASVAINGWVGGGIVQGTAFIRTTLIPFVLVSALVNTRSKQHALFVIIICCSLMMVLNGHQQVTRESGIGLFGNDALLVGEGFRIRSLGFLSDPNDLGMLFVMVIPFAMLCAQNSGKFLSSLFWCSIMALLYGVYLTNSRGTLLAVLALLGVWFWRKYKLYKTLLLGAVMSPVMLIVMSSFREISADEESAQGRLDAWYAGYQMLQINPLFGVGRNAFIDHHELTAHNSFVLAFAELGLLGCLVWVGLLATTIIALLNVADGKFLPQGEDVEISDNQRAEALAESRIALTILYCFVGFMVSGFFLSRTYFPFLYLCIAMGAACAHRAGAIFPDGNPIYNLKLAAKWTFATTFAGILGVSILIRVLG